MFTLEPRTGNPESERQTRTAATSPAKEEDTGDTGDTGEGGWELSRWVGWKRLVLPDWIEGLQDTEQRTHKQTNQPLKGES